MRFGRPRKLSPDQAQVAAQLLAEGNAVGRGDPNDGTDPAAGANSLEGFLIALSALISKQDKQRTAQQP